VNRLFGRTNPTGKRHVLILDGITNSPGINHRCPESGLAAISDVSIYPEVSQFTRSEACPTEVVVGVKLHLQDAKSKKFGITIRGYRYLEISDLTI
jgi:hypothetical protein